MTFCVWVVFAAAFSIHELTLVWRYVELDNLPGILGATAAEITFNGIAITTAMAIFLVIRELGAFALTLPQRLMDRADRDRAAD